MKAIHSERAGGAPRGLISLRTAAALVDVDPKTIRNWISAGHLQGFRVNSRLLRVDRGELLALVQPVATTPDGAA